MSAFLREMKKISVIGESNIDISVVHGSAEARQGSCISGKITFHHGGVARNIAHNLCLLGQQVQLMSVFGDDGFATSLMDECRRLGMDLSQSTQFESAKSPIFLSHNDNTGNMISAISDVHLNDKMNLDWIKGRMDAINRSDKVVADTLLNAETLAYLIDHCQAPLYLDTVSPGKALRLAEALNLSEKRPVFALKCNLAEAKAITEENDPIQAALKLNSMGITNVYLTLGSHGVIFCTQGYAKHFPALTQQVKNVVGSGDAFFAGIIYAHTLGLFEEEALPFGLKTAQNNTESEEPVNPLLAPSLFETC